VKEKRVRGTNLASFASVVFCVFVLYLCLCTQAWKNGYAEHFEF